MAEATVTCIHHWHISHDGHGVCRYCPAQRQFDKVEPQSSAIGWKDYATLALIGLATLQVYNNQREEVRNGGK